MKFDAVVVGGGPGGYVSAIRLSQLGFRVALVEKEDLGGECTNYGCIPSKHLITQAKKIYSLREMQSKNLVKASVIINLAAVVEETRSVVGRLRQGIGFLLKNYGVKVFKGVADVKDPHTIVVKAEEAEMELETGYVVIATGTEPVPLASIPFDGRRVIDYKKALFLAETPRNMLVVGGGAVGLELGTVFTQLGAKVSIAEFMDQLLPGMDADASRAVKRGLEKMGARVFLGTTVDSYRYVGDGVEVSLTNGERDVYEYVLVSVGKRATEWARRLRELGVELDDKGYVKTDERMRTTVENIYAVGDVCGPPFLAHKAHRQGVVAAEAIAGMEVRFDSVVPFGVFTTPEVASVGKTDQGLKSVRFPFSALGRAVADGEEGFVKL
ncbi:MAG: FAD-dependent oxidoreductase, partial [Candidatus Caldarchaeum sp.]|nr:FAD-dependent oxidoreductase [Candidatus Caldarchaeum sp.]